MHDASLPLTRALPPVLQLEPELQRGGLLRAKSEAALARAALGARQNLCIFYKICLQYIRKLKQKLGYKRDK
jgi:hypothetical protein